MVVDPDVVEKHSAEASRTCAGDVRSVAVADEHRLPSRDAGALERQVENLRARFLHPHHVRVQNEVETARQVHARQLLLDHPVRVRDNRERVTFGPQRVEKWGRIGQDARPELNVGEALAHATHDLVAGSSGNADSLGQRAQVFQPVGEVNQAGNLAVLDLRQQPGGELLLAGPLRRVKVFDGSGIALGGQLLGELVHAGKDQRVAGVEEDGARPGSRHARLLSKSIISAEALFPPRLDGRMGFNSAARGGELRGPLWESAHGCDSLREMEVRMTTKALLSVEDYAALDEPDGPRYELSEGELIMTPSPTYFHNRA